MLYMMPFNQDTLTSTKIILYLILPVLLSMYLIPTLISPGLFAYIQTNFRVILLSQQFCQVKPQQCEVLLDRDFGDPNVLYRQAFHHYDLIYVVNKYIWQWDNLIAKLILSSPVRYALLKLCNLRGVEIDQEYWEIMQETIHIILAIINTSIFHVLMGLLVSRMWMFFVVGVVLTVLEPWEKLAGPMWDLLQSANNVF